MTGRDGKRVNQEFMTVESGPFGQIPAYRQNSSVIFNHDHRDLRGTPMP
jgi:hypothetical protein